MFPCCDRRLTKTQAEEAGIVLPVKLLVFNESNTWARRARDDPNLEVAVGDEQIPRADAELGTEAPDERVQRHDAVCVAARRPRREIPVRVIHGDDDAVVLDSD